MSETKRLSERNKLIQEMLTDGEQLKKFYRFTAHNPHISLREACQILIARPDATICYSYDEWNSDELQRRIIAGRKGIPYNDVSGNRHHVFDVSDTHGKKEYKRNVYPMNRLLKGLKVLTDADIDEVESEYWKIQVGVVQYLNNNEAFSEEDKQFIKDILYPRRDGIGPVDTSFSVIILYEPKLDKDLIEFVQE